MSRWWAAAGLLVVALGVVGCGSSPPPGPSTTSTAPTSMPFGAAGPPNASSPSAAKDGTNYAACAQGNCEVLVSGPVSFPVTGRELRVRDVDSDGDVQVSLHDGRGNTVSMSIQEGCGYLIRFTDGGSQMNGCLSGDELTGRPGALVLQVVTSTPAGVVLRLTQS